MWRLGPIEPFARPGRHGVRDGEESMLQYLQEGIAVVYEWDTRKAGLFSYLLHIFQEDATNMFCNALLETTHADLPKLLHQQVGIVTLESVFVMGGFAPTLAYHGTGFNDIEEIGV